MDLLHAFKDFTGKEQLFAEKDRLLIAVSGGMDSVVLCECCHQAGLDFVIAHCNFQLRGDESQRDETFVRRLGEKYNREVLVRRMDTLAYAEEHRLSVQVAARDLRYNWFRELTAPASLPVDPSPASDAPPSSSGESSHPAPAPSPADTPPPRWILTAHHLDDNIETLLMNFFKGTGIAGLRGILPRQGNIIRPLLFAGKEELKKFAELHQLSWVEDSSNASDKYTRNYFRHHLIPLVQQLYPGALQNLADNLPRFRDIETLYQQSIGQHKKKLLEVKGREIHIPVLKLKKSTPLLTIVYEIIADFGFSPQQVPGVIDLLDLGSGKYISSSTHRILKDRNWLIISAHPIARSSNILIESPDDKIAYENGTLKLEWQKVQAPAGRISTDPLTAQLDADTIRFPLLLRKWRPGDYFYPLGLGKKKKLARFFIDNKLSLADKEKVWVLEMDKKIIWVVGLRIDHRFRITPNTQKILKIESGMA